MTDHRSGTDQVKKVQLSSALEHVGWIKPTAALGGKVGLEVFTHFVGNGSDLEIEISDQNGKTFGKYKQKISGNRFWADVKVPAEAKDALYASVKLPKHGLQMKSNPLILLPPVEITNAQWDKKEARRGDLLKLTADVKGAADGTDAEVEIWEYDADGAHDLITKFMVAVKNKKVELEWGYEYQEDTDDIPTEDEAASGYNPPEYFFRVIVGGAWQDSALLTFKDNIVLILKSPSGQPIPNADYVVYLADGSEKRGQLDAEGCAEITNVPPGPYHVEYPDFMLVYPEESEGEPTSEE